MRKLFIPLLITSFVFLQTPTKSHSAIVLSDDFSTPFLDSSKWSLLLPFDGDDIAYLQNVTSVATQNAGELTLSGGASISSKQNFASPYIFSGLFNQTSPGGRTIITLRGDGASFEPNFGAPNGNIFLFFFGDPNNSPNWKVQISQSSL